MADERKIIAVFEEDDELIPEIEIDESEVIVDDGAEIEEIDVSELDDAEVAGGEAGDWVRVGNYIYMAVAPRVTQFCSDGKKGPNEYPKTVKKGTCSCCMYMFRKKGYWLCRQTKTHI